MLPEFFAFHLPTRVVYGAGLVHDLSAELSAIPARRYFLVTDKIIRAAGLADRVAEGFKNSGVEIAGFFDDVPPNSEVQVCIRAAEAAKASGADGLVAVGGGSVIDTAKAANILFTLGGDLINDYSGAETVSQPLAPLVAVPTTAGTGSEATGIAVIYNEAEHVKNPFTSTHLLPALAVLDPEMTFTMPPLVTAATGMDALTHAVEAYLGPQATPFTDGVGLQAIRLIQRNLVAACEAPEDVEARGSMLIAACLAGVSFNHSMVGIVHAMSHTLGGLHHVAHGTANSICLPYGMHYNLPVCGEQLARLAHYLGKETRGLDRETAAEKAIEAVMELRAELKRAAKLPDRLSGVGIKKADLPAIAEGAVMDGTSFYNPREVVAADVLVELERAL
jgi:alcohol dehydrogenase class IV